MPIAPDPGPRRQAKERRHHPRVLLSLPVQVRIGADEMLVLNVSDGGLLLRSPCSLAPDSIHSLVADSPIGGDPFRAWVRIIHTIHVTSAHETSFLMNVAFLSSLDREQQRVVREWIDRSSA